MDLPRHQSRSYAFISHERKQVVIQFLSINKMVTQNTFIDLAANQWTGMS